VEKVLGGIAYVAVAPTDWKAANGEFASAQEAVQGGLVRVGAAGDRQGGLVGGAIHAGAGLLYAADEVLQPGSVKDAALIAAGPGIGKVAGVGVELLSKAGLNPTLGTVAGKLGGAVEAVTAFAKRVVGAEGEVPNSGSLSQAQISARIETNIAQTRAGNAASGFDKFVQNEGRLYEHLDIWPPNLGRVGPVEIVDLQPGTVMDRFGLPYGRFLAPQGTPFEARALPSTYEAAKPYFMYEVVKPIPGVTQSRALPWFGQSGMGVQYELPRGINYLDPSNGYVKVRYHEP
jgi:filamentous hemagglutinin